jgi:TolA-binding protein
MGRRITRKQLKQDEFVSTVDTMIQWGANYWKPAAAGLGIVCAVILLWWVGDKWSSSRTDQASYLLYKAISVYEEQAAGDVVETETTPEAQLQQVIDRYGRSDQADIARVYLARINMDRGDVQTARSLLVEVIDRHPNDALGGLATADLFHIRLAAGEGAEVAQELEAMVAGTDQRLPRDAAMFELGELYLGQKEVELARTYFQKLIDEFSTSSYAGRARQRITEIE